MKNSALKHLKSKSMVRDAHPQLLSDSKQRVTDGDKQGESEQGNNTGQAN